MKSIIKIKGLRILVIMYAILSASSTVLCQKHSIINDAEEHFFHKEYNESLKMYKIILDKDPNNYFIQYKIGLCYLFINNERDKSIPYLQIASKFTSAKVNDFSVNQQLAPVSAHYFLGMAYMYNENYSGAINKFKDYIKGVGSKYHDIINYVNLQIENCKRAITLTKNPICSFEHKIENNISSVNKEFNPVISGDGSTLAFAREENGINNIYISKLINGKWETPTNISMKIGANENCYPTGLSSDGSIMLICEADFFESNIYYSEIVNGEWVGRVKFVRPVNSKYLETHASFSPDDKRIYFSSNRAGGKGGLDIYYVDIYDGFTFSDAVNMGKIINTPFNEDCPFVTNDNKVLYFVSEGHCSIGGFDIFSSHLNNSKWSPPQNIGYPINTVEDELFYMPVGNGLSGLISRNNNSMNSDIYECNIYPDDITRDFDFTGEYSVGSIGLSDDVSVTITNYYNKIDTILNYSLTNGENKFHNTIAEGKYYLKYSGNGIKTFEKIVEIPHCHPNNEFAVLSELENKSTDVFIAQNEIEKENKSTGIMLDLTDIYTIQFRALKSPVDTKYYKKIKKIKVYKGADEFYRYTTGQYFNIEDAIIDIEKLEEDGFEKVFVRKVSEYEKLKHNSKYVATIEYATFPYNAFQVNNSNISNNDSELISVNSIR